MFPNKVIAIVFFLLVGMSQVNGQGRIRDVFWSPKNLDSIFSLPEFYLKSKIPTSNSCLSYSLSYINKQDTVKILMATWKDTIPKGRFVVPEKKIKSAVMFEDSAFAMLRQLSPTMPSGKYIISLSIEQMEAEPQFFHYGVEVQNSFPENLEDATLERLKKSTYYRQDTINWFFYGTFNSVVFADTAYPSRLGTLLFQRTKTITSFGTFILNEESNTDSLDISEYKHDLKASVESLISPSDRPDSLLSAWATDYQIPSNQMGNNLIPSKIPTGLGPGKLITKPSGRLEVQYQVASDTFDFQSGPRKELRTILEMRSEIVGIPVLLQGHFSTINNSLYPVNGFKIGYDRPEFLRGVRRDEMDLQDSRTNTSELLKARLADKRKLLHKKKQELLSQQNKLNQADTLQNLTRAAERAFEQKRNQAQAALNEKTEKVDELEQELSALENQYKTDSSMGNELTSSLEKDENDIDKRDLEKSLKRLGQDNLKNRFLSGLLDFEVGRLTRTYTPLSWDGVMVDGLSVGYDFGRTAYRFAHGQGQDNLVTGLGRTSGNLKLTAGSIRYKLADGNYSKFTLLTGSSVLSIGDKTYARTNNVLSFSQQIRLKERTELHFELANSRTETANDEPADNPLYYALLDPARYGGKFGIHHQFKRQNIVVYSEYEQVNPTFYSSGLVFQRRNFREIKAGGELGFMKGVMHLGVEAKHLTYDLRKKNQAIGAGFKLRFSPAFGPTVDLYYAPYRFYRVATDSAGANEILSNSFEQFRLHARYSFKTASIRHMLSGGYGFFLTEIDTLITQSHNLQANYQLQVKRFTSRTTFQVTRFEGTTANSFEDTLSGSAQMAQILITWQVTRMFTLSGQGCHRQFGKSTSQQSIGIGLTGRMPYNIQIYTGYEYVRNTVNAGLKDIGSLSLRLSYFW